MDAGCHIRKRVSGNRFLCENVPENSQEIWIEDKPQKTKIIAYLFGNSLQYDFGELLLCITPLVFI